MAPMAVSDTHLLKRTSSTAQFDEPPAKKLNRGRIRHHKPSWDLQREQRCNGTFLNDADAQSLLTRSIGLALQAVGFKSATPDALESFRGDVEACMRDIHRPVETQQYANSMLTELDMAHYLADVRRSMLSCRRINPIPQDFLQALHTHQLSLRTLLPHLDPPVLPELSQYPLESEIPQEDEYQQLQHLGSILNDAPEEQAKGYVPKHFPEFPSRHTYKSTDEFPDRKVDPRKVREQATEEGRMGEEALRKLVAASSGGSGYGSQKQQGSDSIRAKRDQMFMETMAAVAAGGPNSMDTEMEMGVGVGLVGIGKGKQKEGPATNGTNVTERLRSTANAERRYWRKPVPRIIGEENGS